VCSMPPYACWPVHPNPNPNPGLSPSPSPSPNPSPNPNQVRYLSCAGPAIAPPAFGSHEFAYLGYDAVLDSAPVRLGLGLLSLGLGLGLGLGLLTLTLTLTLT